MARWVTISTTVNSVFKSLRIILFVQHHRKGLEIPQLIIHLSVAYIRCLQNTRASLRRESLPEELLQHQRTTADRKVNRYAESVPLGFFCLPPCFVLVAKLNAMLATSLSRSRSFGGPEDAVSVDAITCTTPWTTKSWQQQNNRLEKKNTACGRIVNQLPLGTGESYRRKNATSSDEPVS